MDPERIKSIVKKNFDESAQSYEGFEKTYGFFRNLAHKLSDFCGMEEEMSVLDAGCGTGASTFYLSETARKVVGIDLSEEMILMGLKNKKFNTEFIVGDAEKLSEYFSEKFDAVLYNASIFLIPNPQKSLESARGVLKKDGVCGASYLLGLFSQDVDVMEEARKRDLAQDGTFVKSSDIRNAFCNVFGSFEEKRIEISVDIRQVESFYSIQAQSTSLFPKESYEKRLMLLRNLFSYVEKKYEDIKLEWNLVKALH